MMELAGTKKKKNAQVRNGEKNPGVNKADHIRQQMTDTTKFDYFATASI